MVTQEIIYSKGLLKGLLRGMLGVLIMAHIYVYILGPKSRHAVRIAM